MSHNGSISFSDFCSGAVYGEQSISVYLNALMTMMILRSLTTVVEAQEDHLALVHIPLDLYPFFLKPILQVLFHEVSPLGVDRESTIVDVNVDDGPALEDCTGAATPEQPAFLNISITPVECSVMCPRKLADQYFAPLVKGFRAVSSESDSLSITRDDFIAMQVYGEGLEAGQRVLELTSPLAMAGMYALLSRPMFCI